MSLADLIRGKSESEDIATAIPATPATHQAERATTVARIATVAVATPADTKGAEPRQDAARIAKVVATIEANPALRYAMQTHTEVDPADVIVSLAIRGKGACELRIPKSQYDGFKLLEMIERHSVRVTVQ